MKQISIIIATLNSENTVEMTLKSIIPQLTECVELIIIDGGSTDKTMDILHKYTSYIEILISERDEGIYHAWNKGVKLSKGQWIMFIGSDDLLIDGALEHYINLLSSQKLSEYDIISAKSRYVGYDGKLIKIIGEEYSWNTFKHKMTLAHVGALHNIKLFQDVGYFDVNYKICGDYELLLRRKNKLTHYFYDEVITEMRAGGISLSFIAIIETFKAKRQHTGIPLLLLFIESVIGYLLYLRRKCILLQGFNHKS